MLKTLAIILSVFNTVLIPVRFKDQDLVSSREQIENLATDCASYISRQFNGSTYYSITVSEVVTLDHDLTYYGLDKDSKIDPFCYKLVKDACNCIDSSIDFSRFCNNGANKVDLVIFLAAGHSESEGGGDGCLWPQFSSLSKFNTSLTLDNSRIDDFIICPELSGDTVAGAGVICHELGHFIGLPDFYDTDRNGSGGLANNAIGEISLMDNGYKTSDAENLPALTAIEREITGTGKCIDMTPGKHSLTANYHYLKLEGPVEGEYYLVEYNAAAGGLITYYVDKSADEAGYSDRQGRTITAAERWSLNEVNCNPEHLCARTTSGTFRFKNGEQSPLSVSVVGKEGNQLVVKVQEMVNITDLRAYQDGAAIRFNVLNESNSSFTCSIALYQERLIRAIQKPYSIGDELVAVFDGKLIPGEETICLIDISFSDKPHISYETRFKTAWYQKGSIPFIAFDNKDRNPGGSFVKGSLIPLKVWNIPDQKETVWTFNGKKIEGGWLRVESDGELRAEVDCGDGSTQVIVKQIIAE